LSDAKKDLTRIEDLGEFIHELNGDESENFSFEDSPPEVPAESSDVSDDPISGPFNDSFQADETESLFETNEIDEEQTSFEETSNLNFESTFETSEESSFISEEFPKEEEVSHDFQPENVESFDTDFSSHSDESPHEEMISENHASDFTEPEPASLDIISPKPEKILPKIESHFQTPENFSDLKKFAENSNFTNMAAEGNPSFSVLLTGIKFHEDAKDILILLKEHKLLHDSEEESLKRLLRGNFLIPRISEFAAIFISHKLRKFDIDIQLGLADDVHPPKHGLRPEVGLASKTSLYQNQTHHFSFDQSKLELSQIILSTTSSIEGHEIIKHLGIISEHEVIPKDLIEGPEEDDSQKIQRIYSALAKKLRPHALKIKANAIVGINYHLTPLVSEISSTSIHYRLSCTGNLVWVNKL
jgi:uncharacterized protein YbjQ (UPF0145 family)